MAESVHALMMLQYPALEVVLINDGSGDSTLEVLIRTFDLYPIHPIFRNQVQSQRVRGLYRSKIHPQLLVVDKENGGKADALNAGLNCATGELVCAIDADTLIEPDALLRIVRPFLTDENVVAAGGTIRVANGSRVAHGRVLDARVPRGLLAGCQTVEYLRSFLFGRLGWNNLGGNLIISGAFGLFRRESVMQVGGYVHDTVGEDMENFDLHEEFFWPDVIVAVVHGPVAALILSRTRHPLGWLLTITAIGFGLTALAMQYAVLGHTDPALPALGLATHLVTWAWTVGAFGLVLVMPWLLTGEPTHGWVRRAAWTGVAITVGASLPRAFLQLSGAPPNPLAVPDPWAGYLDTAVSSVFLPLAVGFGLVGAGHLVRQWWRSQDLEHVGVGWVIASILLVIVSYVGFEVGLEVDSPLLGLSAAGIFAAVITLPAAILVLVMRHRSWDVDIAVSRGTLWGLLTAAVVGLYVALVWLAGELLPWGRETSGVLAAAALALLAQPARGWLQARVDRLVYGTGSDVGSLLEQLGDAAGGASLHGLAAGLRRSLRLRFVEIRSTGTTGISAISGVPTTAVEKVELRIERRLVGELRISPYPGERLDPRALRLLHQTAGIVAVALELAQVNEELASARDLLVRVRHEERRMLRRELHDSLGPALVGVGLGLAAIDNSTPGLSAANEQLLNQLREELAHRADDVRSMAQSLLPPALDEGRLVDALTSLTGRFDSPGFAVRLEADGADRIDTRRQIAVYHIAAEGLLNAHRHASATRCGITVRDGDSGVTLEVYDDGRGIAADAELGVGLTSMRERVRELGGDIDIDIDRGTRILVRLP